MLTALVEFKGLQERQEVKKELNTNLSIPSGWNERAAPREWAGWGGSLGQTRGRSGFGI